METHWGEVSESKVVINEMRSFGLWNVRASQVVQCKESACHAGDLSSIPGLGKSPGEGNVNPLQYSCLRNSMDRGAWWGHKTVGHHLASKQQQK